MFEENKQLSLGSKRAVFMIAFLGFVLFTALFLNFFLKNSTQGSSASLVASVAELSEREQAYSGLPLPLRLKIPKIDVDSTVEYVGLLSDGAMDVPKDPQGVAWYMFGQKPGEVGSAVIAGHSGLKNNTPAVFDNLHKLRVGDKIFVEDETGATTTFIVREIRKYDPNADAKDVFNSDDGKARLNLITCTGTWNEMEQTRSDRLVVFTEKE